MSEPANRAFLRPKAIAVLLGAVILGEEVRASDAVGMAVMLTAAWLALRDEPPPAARSRPGRPAVAAPSR
ncbi:MAG TPA: hypothetical protein VHK63_05695 [Candidatus Limnocylindria bacterium]|nr:hypothetical protein [Candidatus Limnocylindria bacterium]